MRLNRTASEAKRRTGRGLMRRDLLGGGAAVVAATGLAAKAFGSNNKQGENHMRTIKTGTCRQIRLNDGARGRGRPD
jgi:ferric-dicitrate binding protein FerR (iron transport regulator)